MVLSMKGFQTENKSNYWLSFFHLSLYLIGLDAWLCRMVATISPIEIFFLYAFTACFIHRTGHLWLYQSLLNANFNFTKKNTTSFCLAFYT
jgi:hypothetical protein